MSNRGLNAHILVKRESGFTIDVAISIPPGTTVALLGPNGAGKSTVVDAIAGLLPIDGGRISLDGRVFDDPASGVFVEPSSRRVGTVFQDYALFPHLSVVENVAFGLRSAGVGRAPARERAEVWLGSVGLEGIGHRRPDELSGGQAQRVALARALITEPDLLLLDEPLAAIDISSRTGLRRALAGHLDTFDGPRLLITHDPSEAFLLADEIHVIEAGSLTQSGSADDIRLRPRTSYAADLAGVNLFVGHAAHGMVLVDGHTLQTGDSTLEGPTVVTIHPRAVAVHRERPSGSPRNAWSTPISHVERLGDRARVRFSDPLPMTAEVTSEAADALGLTRGETVWVSIKATEIDATAD